MKHAIALGSIVLLFIALSIGSALRESLTFDEIVHIQEGINHLTSRSFAIDTNNPPLVRELAALPLLFGADRFFARVVVMALGALLIIFVYKSAPLAAFFLALEPTFLAHSHYITLDVGFALFFFLAWWAFTRGRAILFGILFGMAAASKISAWPFTIGIVLWFRSSLTARKLLLSASIALMVIWATYFFKTDVIIAQRLDASRISSKLEAHAELRSIIFTLKTQPVPLGNYLATIKNNLIRAAQSSQRFLLPYNFFLKTPIPLLLLLLVFVIRILRDSAFRKRTEIIWLPMAIIFVISSFSGQEPWVRYLLPAYPFMAIAGAIGIRDIWGIRGIWKKYVRVFCVGLLCWYVVGTLLQYPHFLSYANEFAGRREARYEKLIDSNLDWGQALPDVAAYIRERNPSHVSFSYFGRDNGDIYRLVSNRPWGSHKADEICAFHEIASKGGGGRLVAISATNWHQCGYSRQPQYQKEKIRKIVADTVLIF